VINTWGKEDEQKCTKKLENDFEKMKKKLNHGTSMEMIFRSVQIS
jgi:hypothetical protein